VGGGAPVFACAAPAGHAARPGDCNDADPTALPGGMEACDGVDDDCDSAVDEGAFNVYHADADGDGFGRMGAATAMACAPPAGFAPAGDCDDTRATVFPAAPERCNRIDDDCDGTSDELPEAATGCAIPGATASCSFGVCTIGSCDVGRANCNGAAADGCEVELATSPAHCSMCGMACRAGDACAGGSCQLTRVVLLRASEHGTFALRTSGGGGVWGDSNSGVLGDGGTGVRESPVPSVRDDIVDLALGVSHGCAVLVDGRVACWGNNASGQLGDGTTATSLAGVIVPGLADVIDVGVGSTHSCAVRSGGELLCWGSNTDGQLGLGMGVTATMPRTVTAIPDAVEVEGLRVGTCVRRRDGRVACWGRNDAGQVGNGMVTPAVVFSPFTIPGFGDAVALARSSGTGDHMCAVRSGGGLLCWGKNDKGQVGDGTAGGNRPTPVSVTTLAGIAEVAVGAETSCARKFVNEMFCWGAGDNGELGNGGGHDAMTMTATPGRVFDLGYLGQSIAVGRNHVCALFDSPPTQVVRCWGNNARNQFGNASATLLPETSTPQNVDAFP
jgi:alpha-tubulin suppressor-like RCC1 family protein